MTLNLHAGVDCAVSRRPIVSLELIDQEHFTLEGLAVSRNDVFLHGLYIVDHSMALDVVAVGKSRLFELDAFVGAVPL